jgi:hypothetical protein
MMGELYLHGLTELSDAVAESLGKHKGDLFLNGVFHHFTTQTTSELSDAAAAGTVPETWNDQSSEPARMGCRLMSVAKEKAPALMMIALKFSAAVTESH